jgi:hypothetical protein
VAHGGGASTEDPGAAAGGEQDVAGITRRV